MTIERIFFVYMAAAGIAAGAIVIGFPKSQNFVIGPYFWVLIAMAAFELGGVMLRQGGPMPLLNTPARLLGLIIGVVLLFVIASYNGVQPRLF